MAWHVTPTNEEVAFLMEAGLIYRDSGKFADAEAVFRGVRALIPASEVPEVALGTLAVGQGDFKAAVLHYQNAIKLNERSAFAHAHLGEAYVLSQDFQEARKHLGRALELDPRHEAGRFAKGVLEFLDQQTKKQK